MFTQSLLDWLAAILAGLLNDIPHMPADWLTIIGHVSSAGITFAGYAAKFGPLVPFGVINQIMNTWVDLLGLWAAVLLVRLGLWIANR